jgi:hypothetical protein
LKTSDQITTVRSDGTYVQNDTFSYLSSGHYLGGLVVSDHTTTTRNGSSQPSSNMTYSYVWYGSAKLSTQTNNYDTSNASKVWTTTYGYNQFGNVQSASIQDGTPRSTRMKTTLCGFPPSR